MLKYSQIQLQMVEWNIFLLAMRYHKPCRSHLILPERWLPQASATVLGISRQKHLTWQRAILAAMHPCLRHESSHCMTFLKVLIFMLLSFMHDVDLFVVCSVKIAVGI